MTVETDLIRLMVAEIRPILAGHAPMIQSATLADCLATWLAGHYVEGKAAKTRTLRHDLLEAHIALVLQLLPVNAKAIGTPE